MLVTLYIRAQDLFKLRDGEPVGATPYKNSTWNTSVTLDISEIDVEKHPKLLKEMEADDLYWYQVTRRTKKD